MCVSENFAIINVHKFCLNIDGCVPQWNSVKSTLRFSQVLSSVVNQVTLLKNLIKNSVSYKTSFKLRSFCWFS